jgi:NhaA family Na+:H+ antiporter
MARDVKQSKVDVAIGSTLAVCAVVATLVLVRREFLHPLAPVHAQEKAIFVQDWLIDSTRGSRLGDAEAPVQLVEFGDFECPFCRRFQKVLREVKERYPKQIALIYIHFPIEGHRFALPAARVAECANEQGRFEAMYNQLFEGQDQFGLKPWDDYATAAGLPDIPAFDACIKRTDLIPRVEEGKALGAKLDVQGTPTIIINGWKLGRPPTPDELDQMVKAILAGKSPVGSK